MRLIIFDIDGTLANTQEIEDYCFKKAFLETLGIDISSQEWHTLVNVTDLGITNEIFFREKQKPISNKEVDAFKENFISHLSHAFSCDKQVFKEISGAKSFFNLLTEQSNLKVAIATGSWSGSAKIKLEAIGIPYQEIPFSHSDDFISRQEIIKDAIEKSRKIFKTDFEKIIYFGDGIWDFKTCESLKIPFIGVDHNSNGKLKSLGAAFVIKDFLKPLDILDLMDKV